MKEGQRDRQRGPSIIERGSLVAAMLYAIMDTLRSLASGCHCTGTGLLHMYYMRLCSEKLVFDIRQRTLYLGWLFAVCTWLVCVCCWHIACLLAFLRAPDSVSSLRKKEPGVHLNVRLTARPCPFILSLSLSRDRDGQSAETTENRSSLTSQFAKTIEKHIHLFSLGSRN